MRRGEEPKISTPKGETKMPMTPRRYTEPAWTVLTVEQYAKLQQEQKPGEKISATLRRLLEERWANNTPKGETK
jgi:hypothetical protein